MIQSVKGTKDILPDSITSWQFVEGIFKKVSDQYGYEELRTPIFEKTEVFSRSIGEGTDIVNKEMYTFTDKGGESMTLRPEMTAALVRSVIQHSLMSAAPNRKFWYFGPFFRYERPQKGRFRQFHQYGAECIGSPYPESDAEIIMLAVSLIKAMGIENIRLLINSLGNEASRARYRDELVSYLLSVQDNLSGESRSRIEINPLRVLDSKAPQDIEILASAPVISDYLDEESRDHFERVKALTADCGAEIVPSPRLVRGLDYYSHTVFEFQSSALGAQDSFGGGGRYNTLFEQLGGKATPAVGFAFGVERLLMILESLNKLPDAKPGPDAFMVCASPAEYAEGFKTASLLRERNLTVICDLNRRSMKSQFKEADRSKAKYAIIIGEDELKSRTVMIKNMASGEQTSVSTDRLGDFNFA